MKKPIIGITLDNEEPGYYSKFPWYAIRKNYLHSIEEVGGIPFPLFHSLNNIDNIMNLIDGVIITGGDFDISPSIYGQLNKNSRNEKESRTFFEIELCNKSLQKNIPILGICGGEQLINIVFGGTLIQDIQSLNYETIEHEQTNPRNQTSHKVIIEPETLLYKIVKETTIEVNSAHHQAINKLGIGLKASSKAKDGVIESIESINHKWCIGLQWHPEFLITKQDKLIFIDFINQANKN